MIDLALPASMAIGFVAWYLIARWYFVPWAEQQDRATALKPLLLLHSFRYIGLAFLISGVTTEPLDPRFAIPAAWGDLLAALLALVALRAVHACWRFQTALVWLFNVVGALDLVNAVTQGLRYTADYQMGATYFIPAVIVPMLLVSHGVIAWLLLRRERLWERHPAAKAA